MGRAERVESGVQLALMLGVGGIAAAAAWSHVLDLARSHGQGGWLAWAVAACTETAAVSAGLEVRRRRRVGQPVRLPLAVIVLATVLQLAAQVAQAEHTAWGVVLAAVPAVTFLVLVKLALSRAPAAASPAEAEAPAAVPEDPPAAAPPPARRARRPAGKPRTATTGRHRATGVDELLPVAREVAAQLAAEGTSLSRAALARGLRDRGVPVRTSRAGELVAALRDGGNHPPAPATATADQASSSDGMTDEAPAMAGAGEGVQR